MPPRGDFTDLLVKKKLLDPKQITEAEKVARAGNLTLADALAKINAVTYDDIAKAQAEFNGLKYLNLAEIDVSADVVRQMPESVAREHSVLCIAADEERMTVVVA